MRNNRPSVQSLLLIFLIAFLGIAATQALFSDVERSQKGVFVVGTLDLAVKGKGGGAAESIIVDNIGADDALAGGKTWVINNVGSLPGKLLVGMANLNNLENSCNEPEALQDQTCGDPGENEGELGKNVLVTFVMRQGNQEEALINMNLAVGADASLSQLWQQRPTPIVVPAGESLELTMNWDTKDSAYANEVQGDSVTFDLLFELEQITGGN